MVVLFITRKFPPSTGGMERVAYELSQQLSEIADVKLIKWGGSKKWLPLVLPYLLFKPLWTLFTTNVQVIYLQDGLLATLGLILKITTRKPVAITIHGLDITYENRLYQFMVPKCVRRHCNRVRIQLCVPKGQRILRKVNVGFRRQHHGEDRHHS